VSAIGSGHYSPLRYPGGKGKLAKFIRKVIEKNGFSDGHYIEPYAGGAAIACEMLLTGIVDKVTINDASYQVYSFWNAVITETDRFVQKIYDAPLTVDYWSKQKNIFKDPLSSQFDIGFATFFLNRTNRSGILNGGVIGGQSQTGQWKIDARFNKAELIKRIESIASQSSKITVSNMDALELIKEHDRKPLSNSVIYLDPPYYLKGRDLYYDFYSSDDHAALASVIRKMRFKNWIVSYDDVEEIRALYRGQKTIVYEIGYSAKKSGMGREVMFFGRNFIIPEACGSMREYDRRAADSALTI
jgi:DNA adenine methylase